MGKLNLHDMTTAKLKSIIEEDYYRACIQGRGMHEGADQAKLDKILDDLLVTEKNCASIERYDLAVLCRDMAAELTMNLDLNISI